MYIGAKPLIFPELENSQEAVSMKLANGTSLNNNGKAVIDFIFYKGLNQGVRL